MKITKFDNTLPQLPKRINVAAYARVSDGKDAMLKSLAAQVSYYSAMIQNNPEWEYAGVFADEALTGTKDTRAEFQKLLTKCRNGEVDLVLTKSITRFARNTVTLLETVRELKLLGVDVYFEEQNIHSRSEDGELMLTLFASYAQEESRSVSENCKWRIQKRFEAGEPPLSWHMYGYDMRGGEITINDNQAAVIRQIFADYIGGMGIILIARKLNELGIPAYNGGEWHDSTVHGLLKNEKLIGDCLCQKTYITDHLTKRSVNNNGERNKYYVEDLLPAIIDRNVYETVQRIMSERNVAPGGVRKSYQFTSKIVCGCCGKNYKRHKNVGTWKWQCSTYLEYGKSACGAKQIPESVLERLASEVADITLIRIIGANEIEFVLPDGSTVIKQWADRSRRDSWTPEKREAARQRELERRSHG